MKIGFIRSLRFDMYIFIITMLPIIPILIATYIFYPIIGLSITADFIGISFAYLPAFLLIIRSINYYKSIVGFSMTRRNYFLSGTVTKAISGLFAVLVGFLSGFIAKSIPFHNVYLLMAIFFTALAVGSLGDVIGTIVYRFRTVGYFLYFIWFIAMGIGFAFSASYLSKQDYFNNVSSTLTSPYLYFALLFISVVLWGLNWILIKKMAIQS